MNRLLREIKGKGDRMCRAVKITGKSLIKRMNLDMIQQGHCSS